VTPSREDVQQICPPSIFEHLLRGTSPTNIKLFAELAKFGISLAVAQNAVVAVNNSAASVLAGANLNKFFIIKSFFI
jgi:hypothetical protein